MLKEVVIDDPDYNMSYATLNELYSEAHSYRKENRLKRMPSLGKIFFNEKAHTLGDIDNKLETLVEELGNSKNKKVIIYLNEYPILSPNATVSPFRKRWLNVLSIIIFPVALVIYLRAIKFRLRLSKDLVKIEKTSRKLIEILKKEKLIEEYRNKLIYF
jgi:lipopolysaccharide export system permease protein